MPERASTHRRDLRRLRIENGRVFADGGRVLNVSASGASLEEARTRAYAAIERIDWPGGFCRRDIGWRVLGGTS